MQLESALFKESTYVIGIFRFFFNERKHREEVLFQRSSKDVCHVGLMVLDTQFGVEWMLANKPNDYNRPTNRHTHLSINKVLNSSQELMHTSSRSEVNWPYKLIITPEPIKDCFTVSMI